MRRTFLAAVAALLIQCAYASGGKAAGGGAVGGGGAAGNGPGALPPPPAPPPAPGTASNTPSTALFVGNTVTAVFGVMQGTAAVTLPLDQLAAFDATQPLPPAPQTLNRKDATGALVTTDTITFGPTSPYISYSMGASALKSVTYTGPFSYVFNHDYVDAVAGSGVQTVTASISVVNFGFAEQVVFQSNPIYDTAQGGWVFSGYTTYADVLFDSSNFKPYVLCSLMDQTGTTVAADIGILSLPMDATTLASFKPKQGVQSAPFSTATGIQPVNANPIPVPYSGQTIQCVSSFGGKVANKVSCKTGCVAAPTGRRMLKA